MVEINTIVYSIYCRVFPQFFQSIEFVYRSFVLFLFYKYYYRCSYKPSQCIQDYHRMVVLSRSIRLFTQDFFTRNLAIITIIKYIKRNFFQKTVGNLDGEKTSNKVYVGRLMEFFTFGDGLVRIGIKKSDGFPFRPRIPHNT